MGIKKTIEIIIVIIILMFLVWFELSYFEVLSKNLNGNVTLSKLNLFSFFL